MTQNRSSAVMQQRSEPHDSLDDFPTPPWGTRALIEHVLKPFMNGAISVTEPACNRGYMVRPLAEYFHLVHASDVFDYGKGFEVNDFLFPGRLPASDFMITNPPFRLAQQFITRGLEIARRSVSVLVRIAFLEGIDRYNNLYSVNPPTFVSPFVERLPMVKGRVDPDAQSATCYCWLTWIKGEAPRPPLWIPPCRKMLEREGDYA